MTESDYVLVKTLAYIQEINSIMDLIAPGMSEIIDEKEFGKICKKFGQWEDEHLQRIIDLDLEEA